MPQASSNKAAVIILLVYKPQLTISYLVCSITVLVLLPLQKIWTNPLIKTVMLIQCPISGLEGVSIEEMTLQDNNIERL